MMESLVLGCVSENNPKYLSQALRLLQSIRWFGGQIACVDFIVCIVDGIEGNYKKEFTKYGASVRVVPRYSRRHPQSNKLRFLQLKDLEGYERIILLDCDTIIVQDPTPYISSGTFMGKIADAPTIPHDVFERLFNFFKLPLPRQEYRCTVTRDPTILYCNAGVLVFSQSAMETLVPKWIKYNDLLIQQLELLGEHANFCEQASLSLACVACKITFHQLSNKMNYPLHWTLPEFSSTLDDVDPVIIHYHSLVDEAGYILNSVYPYANSRINLFNQKRREKQRPITGV